MPGAASQADHAWMWGDCSPAAGGRVFEIRLLGPVRAIRLGREVALGGPQKRAVLALLVLEAGRVVPAGPPSPCTRRRSVHLARVHWPAA